MSIVKQSIPNSRVLFLGNPLAAISEKVQSGIFWAHNLLFRHCHSHKQYQKNIIIPIQIE